MADDFNASKPIYMQLADRINRQILRKELAVGQKLPSVREMAIQSGVNPNTVQRTYSELERMGSVESKRGQGTFVTENQSVLNELRQNLKKEQISSFFADMKEMGFSAEEMISGLKEFISTEERGEQRD
ncbi:MULTISPECIES: GntR family transcriptional regulator [Fictibacillus]|uniref:GntR family transcriptional regulator n=1 Tax=Fictibacillus terranigra TaxID=3058424 RepID=A0ABT8E7V3_9BACL|nr:GntR family transcriptional regulator [Fictibacillus sp. CENA-BCM004]MDN4073970.1 GntR family transcriptional regulator [Fictibacillus sp. CENA-BCM004]